MSIEPFDWQRLLVSDQAPGSFLLEIVFRSVLMFVLTIGALRISGKRGVRQLSLFEFGLILILGSAAGDATFYHDVPLLYAVLVFAVIIALYVGANYLIDRHPNIERLVEGEPELIIENGEIDFTAFSKAPLTARELFGQLRQYQVEHLGQVRRLYIEATGEVSAFFFEPQDERPGLPIWPEIYHHPLRELLQAGPYACHACATVRALPAGPVPAQCPRCGQAQGWLPVCATPRIASPPGGPAATPSHQLTNTNGRQSPRPWRPVRVLFLIILLLMEPTSHQSLGGITGSANATAGSARSENTSSVDSTFSTTAAHATGDTPYPTDATAQPDGSLKGKLNSAVESGKKWLNDSGVAEQAQQLPQKAKDLGNQAWTSISGLTNTQKAVGVGLLAAGVAFLAVRSSRSKKQAPEYRDRPRKSPFDHQPHTKDGDHAYDRKGQRPWGASRYGSSSAPYGKSRVTSGSGYTSAPSAQHSPDFGRAASSNRSTSVGSSTPSTGQRRDQGPASGNKYDANSGGSQNPNNLE